MHKTINLAAGTSFGFEQGKNTLFLKHLFSMTCSMNTVDDENPSRAGLAVICAGNKRYEGNMLQSEYERDNDSFRFTQRTYDNRFKLDAVWKYSEDHKIISCKYKLTNTGDEKSSVRRVFPRFVFSSAEYELYSQLNRWGLENKGAWQTISGAGLVLKARTARSTVSSTPFCVLRNTETKKAIAFQLVPKGDWIIKVTSAVINSEAPLVLVELGLSDEDLFFELSPRESIDLPEVIIQEVPNGEIGRLTAPLHRYLNGCHLKDSNLNLPPVIYNTWLYRFSSFTVEQLRQQLAVAKRIGCEYFVIDAGWFGPDGGAWDSVGDWREKTASPFFGKMNNFADEVRDAGLKFGLWMEPERYARNIPIRKEHSDWFPENSLRIDLTIPEASDYFFNSIKDVVERYDVKYLKLDFNSPDSGYDESGTEFYNYCNSLDSQLLRLRKTFPDLIIENCGSGGLCTDLNTARIYDLSFPSDNTHPYETLRVKQGAMLRMPLGRILSWAVMRQAPERLTKVDDDIRVLCPTAATWDEMALFDLDFTMISNLAGVLGFSGDLASLDDKTIEKITQYCSFYKGKREMLTTAHVHLLTDPEYVEHTDKWLVFQIQSTDMKESLVYAFSNAASHRGSAIFALRGLESRTQYEVEQVFPGKQNESCFYSGEELMESGLNIQNKVNQHIKYTASLYIIKKINLQ